MVFFRKPLLKKKIPQVSHFRAVRWVTVKLCSILRIYLFTYAFANHLLMKKLLTIVCMDEYLFFFYTPKLTRQCSTAVFNFFQRKCHFSKLKKRRQHNTKSWNISINFSYCEGTGMPRAKQSLGSQFATWKIIHSPQFIIPLSLSLK